MEFNKSMKFSELAEVMGEEPGNGGSNRKETEYIKYFSSSSDYICLNKTENVNYKEKGRKRKFSKIKFPVVFENEVI